MRGACCRQSRNDVAAASAAGEGWKPGLNSGFVSGWCGAQRAGPMPCPDWCFRYAAFVVLQAVAVMVGVALVAFACFLYTAPAGPVMMESAAEKALKYEPSLAVSYVGPQLCDGCPGLWTCMLGVQMDAQLIVLRWFAGWNYWVCGDKTRLLWAVHLLGRRLLPQRERGRKCETDKVSRGYLSRVCCSRHE